MSVVRSFSIVQLIWIAFIAVALPLTWAVMNALYQLDALIENNSDAIVRVKQETLLSRSIAETLTSLERSANQYRVLKDPTLRDVYITHRDEFRSLVGTFLKGEPDATRREIGRRLISRENTLNKLLIKTQDDVSVSSELVIADLRDDAKRLVARTDRLLVEQSDLLTQKSRALKQQLITQAFLAIPIALALGAVFFIIITKPIRQLDIAVRSLGKRNLNTKIKISGPNDLRELGERLNWLRIRLNEVDQQKDAFLRNISHELKTPLTSIREGTSLLNAKNCEVLIDEQDEIIEIIKKNTAALQSLIENLLRFNELTASAAAQRVVDFNYLVDSALDDNHILIKKKKLRIRRNIETCAALVNPTHMKLIIDNLVSNAIRFSPSQGQIVIDIYIQASELNISVEDAGPGVAMDDTSHIFDIFYRGKHQPQDLLKGSGVGLAIVKEIVERANGEVRVLAGSGNKGARFCVNLDITTDGLGYRDSAFTG